MKNISFRIKMILLVILLFTLISMIFGTQENPIKENQKVELIEE